jgi:hypothetical protein
MQNVKPKSTYSLDSVLYIHPAIFQEITVHKHCLSEQHLSNFRYVTGHSRTDGTVQHSVLGIVPSACTGRNIHVTEQFRAPKLQYGTSTIIAEFANIANIEGLYYMCM